MTGAENRNPLFGIIESLLRMIWSENGNPLFGIRRLTLPVQDGDQREQPAGGFEVDPYLALQAFLQSARTFVVDAAAAHVDGLDLVRRPGTNRLIIAVADSEVVLHDPPERCQ